MEYMKSLEILGTICIIVGFAFAMAGTLQREQKGASNAAVTGILVMVLGAVLLPIGIWAETRGVPRPNIGEGTYQVLTRTEVPTEVAFSKNTGHSPQDKWLILFLGKPDLGACCYRFRADLVDRERALGENETFVVKKGSFTMRMTLYEKQPQPQTDMTIIAPPTNIPLLPKTHPVPAH